MAVQTSATTAAILMAFCIASCACHEEMSAYSQKMLDDSGENTSHSKRFPDHLNPAIPPAWFWFNIGECPETEDGAKQFYCPTLLPNGKHVCIDGEQYALNTRNYQLCNGVKECPNAEDENAKYCLFYRALKANVEGLERNVKQLVHEYMRTPARRYSHGITYNHPYE